MLFPSSGSPKRVCATNVLVCALTLAYCVASAQDMRRIDPSGTWKNNQGSLSLMLAGDALSFTYSSVFGMTAHICDGAGVAGLVFADEYEYTDESGSIKFTVSDNEILMSVSNGTASFCGASWNGDKFTRKEYTPPARCSVAAAKAHFFSVMTGTPAPRKGYVVKGDIVETTPVQNENAPGFILARYRGRKSSTVGLLKTSALDCGK